MCPLCSSLSPGVWRGPGLHTELWRNQRKLHFFCVFPFLDAYLEMCWTSLSGVPSPTCMNLVEGADAITIKSCCRCLKHCLGLLDSSLVPTAGAVHLCLTLRLRWRRVCALAEPDSCSLLRGRKSQQGRQRGAVTVAIFRDCCLQGPVCSASFETVLFPII